ncbi:GntR family transcriptional regulator [Streptomyces sp. DT24]|uniref:GntR family transcriptional regulator n=1 Tax=unclassified Streptomyces TaxID=2593676 RepID=UPI0023B98BDA|nr:GntR family transcriptional regulator [Streptomyces sp. AM 4-1-1]WEH37172.1 GntR family transcriptional regulator [Streptomyces sp. AM 4-1-1]
MRGSGQVGPAARRGLADEVADRIREAVFDGTFAPGAALREVELAGMLQVSRGPVREALIRLEREGLVVSGWHRGTVVRTLSTEDIREIYSLRAALDRLAVATAVEHAGEADLAALDAVVDRMADAVRDGATETVLALDMEFHDLVYRAAGHGRLEEAWRAIRSQVHLFLLTRAAGSDDYRPVVVAEHRAIVEAVRSGDTERAVALCEEHLREAYQRLVARS